MSNKNLKIYCHPRSGSNYLAEVIDLNFFKTGNYRNWYGGHILPTDEFIQNEKNLYIYLYRDFDEVIKSVYKLKERFGLDCNSVDELKNSKLKDIFNPKMKTNISVNHHSEVKNENKISHHFASIDMTPYEYHQYHINSWMKYKNSNNVLFINYADLVNDFQNEMKKIAVFLGKDVPKNGFLNIDEKVGYIPNKLPTQIRLYNFFVRVINKLKKEIKG